MNRVSKNALRRTIEPLLRSLPLKFHPYSEKIPYLSSSKIAYCHEARAGVRLFITLYLNPDGGDWFTLMFGWSTMGRYPHVIDLKFIIDDVPNSVRFGEVEYIERSRIFLKKDIWWMVDSKDDTKFGRTIGEIEEVLRNGVIPYLQDFLMSRQLPTDIHAEELSSD